MTSGNEALGALVASVLQHGGGLSGWGQAPPPGVATWRRVVQNPTVSLARMVALAPVRAALARASVVPAEGEEGDEVVELAAGLTAVLRPLVAAWAPHALTGVDYGRAVAEVVWSWERVEVGAGQRWFVPARLKPLLPEITEAVQDNTGAIVAATNMGVRLERDQFVWFAYDAEADDPLGRGRAERVRRVWHAWERCLDRLGQYAAKVAGVTPLVQYPEGESLDEKNALRSNYDLAVSLIAQLGLGLGVAMPNVLARYAADLAERGVSLPEGSKAWMIDFLEPKAAHGTEIVEILKGLDRFLLRGYLVPERAATEGTHGTKAEAESHGSLVLAQADDVAGAVGCVVQEQLLDMMVRLHLGSGAVGSLRFVVPPLADAEASLVRDVVRSVLTNSATIETVGRIADFEAMFRGAGVPIDEVAVAEAEAVPAAPVPGPDPEDDVPGRELSRLARALGSLPVG